MECPKRCNHGCEIHGTAECPRSVYEDEIDDLRARLAECEEQIEQYEAKRVSWCAETDELLAENRRLRGALNLATAWCRYRRNAGYDTCEDNCSKAYRYQEQCPIYLPTVEQSPTTAEVERVKRLEAFKEQAAKAVDGCDWIGVRSQCPFGAALAELENEK